MTLAPTRGTKLYKNGQETLSIEFLAEDQGPIAPLIRESIMISGTFLGKIGHMGIATMKGWKVIVPPEEQYLIINTSDKALILNFNQNIEEEHEVLWDPYLYENEEHTIVKAESFKESHNIPEGYVDTLEKWYSVKFTYPDENYIFVKPGLGISIQSHMMREEHWEVLSGNPIIIHGAKVKYNAQPGEKFDIPPFTLHTVINPSKEEWILIKERYSGKFDEEDITRVFNPNNYVSPNDK